MAKNNVIDPKNIISKNYLDQINQAVSAVEKTYSSLVESPVFQDLIKNQSKIQEMVINATRHLYPIAKSIKMQEDLIKTVSDNRVYISQSPQIKLYHPKESYYTEEEVEKIVKDAIYKTIKKINNKDLNIKPINKFPYNLSSNKISWENIVIKFKDRHNVEIVAGEDIYVANYKEMGFEDSRKLKPNIQWIFLEVLSKNHGGVTRKESHSADNLKKQKQLLSKKLKEYFDINKDPFYRFSKKNGYQIKVTLVPEYESINDNIPENKNDDLGINDYYKTVTE